jgi:hypothetical protein
MAQIHPVHNIIEDTHKLGQGDGSRHPQNGPGDAALAEIVGVFQMIAFLRYLPIHYIPPYGKLQVLT